METTHDIHVGDARSLALPDESVELVVTSPPYPMVEMWDDLFASLNPAIETYLAGDGDERTAGGAEESEGTAGDAAFDAMHALLDEVWGELARVLVDGGIACINIGDATRTVERFRVYRNHARIADTFERLGFDPLPDLLWRKPTNSGAKFMGSGMLPPSAYVTLEHEYILVFRKGSRRRFQPGADRRYEAAYFWEERNRWFSDIWEIQGERQALTEGADHLRERSGAFPFEIPYRLILMYSVYGDTVLDPFWGTGTTTLAALAAGRNSVGYELDPAFADGFDDRIGEIEWVSEHVGRKRLEAHREFVSERQHNGNTIEYDATHYEFPVMTKQERNIRLYRVTDVSETDGGYRATHTPI